VCSLGVRRATRIMNPRVIWVHLRYASLLELQLSAEIDQLDGTMLERMLALICSPLDWARGTKFLLRKNLVEAGGIIMQL
jgi:ABC-type transport system involved in cytochrome c biogenesis permease component